MLSYRRVAPSSKQLLQVTIVIYFPFEYALSQPTNLPKLEPLNLTLTVPGLDSVDKASSKTWLANEQASRL